MTTEEKSKKEEPKEESDTTNQDEEKSATIKDVKEIVEGAIEKVKSALVGESKPETDKGEEKETERKTREPGDTALSPRRIERMAEELVQKAAAKVFSEKEHEEEHKKLAKIESKKETEKPPVHRRFSTKFWLGNYGEE